MFEGKIAKGYLRATAFLVTFGHYGLVSLKKRRLPESMKGSTMKSVKVIWASVLGSVVLAVGLAACGGSSDPVLVASSDVTAS
ncbi:MAG: hypothetical protein KF686_15115, partial [Ramlibacter sp.]|nr:hypothetical protein [Ramlibacter sp.]